MNVTVINPFRVTQTGSHTFTMSTADKLEKAPDKKDIKVMQEGSTIDNAVKEVKLSEDKMSVEVTMEIPFVDQKKYEVTFGKEKDSFVASVGAPDAINIKTQSAVVNKPTEIEYAVVDAKGMDVTKTIDESKISVDVTTKHGNYDLVSKKLTLWEIGKTAEATVTYHTWTYDQKTGKENVKEAKATITCVDKSAITVTGLDKWTIAERVLSWDTDEMKTVIPQMKTSKIWVRMKKSDGTYVNNKDNAADFTFERINSAVLHVTEAGSVYGVREGTEYAKVTYFDGTVKYQYTLPITVGAKAKPTSIILSQSYVTISHTASEPTMITMKILDQYGETIEIPVLKEAKHLNGADVATIAEGSLSKDNSMRKLNIVGLGKQGTGVYKITASAAGDDLNITLTVNARDVSSITTNDYMLKAEVDEFDATLREDTTVTEANVIAQGIELNLFATKAGLIDKKVNEKMDLASAEFTINGRAVKFNSVLQKLTKEPGADKSLIFRPVIKDSNDQYVSLVGAGVYTISVKFKEDDKTYMSSTSIVIKNDTEKPVKDKSYTVEKIKAKASMSYIDVIKQAIAESDSIKKGTAAHTLSENAIKETSLVLGTKDGKAGKFQFNGETELEALKGSVIIDSAALPSFRLEEGAKPTVWVLVDRLNQKLEIIEPIEVGTLTHAIEGLAGKVYYGTGVTTTPAAKATVRLTSDAKEIENLTVKASDFEISGTNSENYTIAITTEKVVGNKKKLDVKFTITLKDGKTATAGDELKVKYVATSINAVGTLPSSETANLIAPTEVNASTVAIAATTIDHNEFNDETGKEIVATVTGTGLTQLAKTDQLYDVAKWDVAAGSGTGHDNFAIIKVVAEGTTPTDTEVKVKLTVKNAKDKTVEDGNKFKVKTKDLKGSTATATSADEITTN